MDRIFADLRPKPQLASETQFCVPAYFPDFRDIRQAAVSTPARVDALVLRPIVMRRSRWRPRGWHVVCVALAVVHLGNVPP